MRWIDMHCDTVSEIYKNRKGTLMKNTLCVDMERLERAGSADAVFLRVFVNFKRLQNRSDGMQMKRNKESGYLYTKCRWEQVKIRKVKTEHIRRLRRMISYAKEK